MRRLLFFPFFIIYISLFSQTQTGQDSIVMEKIIFEKVEIEASFPGGEIAWRKYLEENLNPNTPVENGAPVGIYSVLVQFVVDRDGSVSDLKALTKFGYGMEAEVIRILKKSPNWQPATQNAKIVKAYRKQQVTFVVDAEEFSVEMNEKYILYIGIENHVKITVDKTKSENVLLIPSQGIAVPAGDGNYKLKVTTPGKAIIDIYNKKKNKSVGSIYFIVKTK